MRICLGKMKRALSYSICQLFRHTNKILLNPQGNGNGAGLYASFLKGQGHEGIFSLVKGHPMRNLGYTKGENTGL